MPNTQNSAENNEIISTVRKNTSPGTQDNTSREQINNTNEETQIKLYAYRYVIVVLYCLLNFINGVHWVTFAACASKFGEFYNLNHFLVDLFSLLFMIEYPIFCVPEAYLIDNISIRIGLSISAILLIIGALLKIFINTSMAFAYIGQFLTAAFQPAILNSPGKIASTWFNESSRSIVTSICCASNTIGVIFGYLIHTFVFDDDIEDSAFFKKQFKKYLLIEFIMTAVVCVIFIIFMKSKPELPPSISKNVQQTLNLKESYKKLFYNKDFILILVSLTCVVGFINVLATIYNSYMNLYKVSDTIATYTVGVANVAGIIFSLVVSIIVDKNKKYIFVMDICNIISLIFMILTTILLDVINNIKAREVISFIFYSLIIGFAVPIYTVGMDYACEITYPVGESTSEGIIMSFNQVAGIIGIFVCDAFRSYLDEYKYLSNLFCVLLFIVSLISLLFSKTSLNRTLKDTEKENKQIENNAVNE